MSNWQFLSQGSLRADLLEFTADPLLAQLLVHRGQTTVEQARRFLDPAAYRPSAPQALPDMDLAEARLNQAIEQGERLCVWGDFDVDGQTATALLVATLQSLGANVCFYIPDRLTESHGIKLPALRRLLADRVKLILTCDTGIDAHDAVTAARAAGVDVIITDHHNLPETLPPAQAVINPKRLPPDHPLRELPGVGVAFKLAQALYTAHGRTGDSEDLLDLVALGIVADVAQQTGDTRYLLQKGLGQLQRTERVGLQALIESAHMKTARLTEEHIGFWLAPRLNALGRLGDANLAVELLTTNNRSRARIIALQLEAFNERRKLLVDRVVIQALSQIEDAPSLAEKYQAIVLAAADWHPGVLGIAASRLVNQYAKPAILIALRPDGLGHGSARSVPGCDIYRALKTQAHLLTSFGGHPLAAGLAIQPEHITTLRRGLSEALADCPLVTEKTITIDAVVELPRITAELLATIQRLAPFGAGNPSVSLGCRGLRIVEEVIFGNTAAHKRLVVQDETGHRREVIWWGGADEQSPQGTFDLAFTLRPDNMIDNKVQISWLEAREWTPAQPTTPIEFIDWRHVPDSQLTINITQLTSSLIWAEGPFPWPNLTPLHRYQLQPAAALVVWYAPPGPDIFHQVVNVVKPQQLFLVAQPSPFDAWPAFIKQLMGLIKHALAHREGEVDLMPLAAALGHRSTTARLGIDWLVAQGKLSIYVEEEDLLVLRPAQNAPAEAATVETILKSELAETAAYRRFFREASLGALKKMVV